MNRLKAVALLFGVILSASSCAPKDKQHESLLQVDSDFTTYVSNFEQVSAQEGQTLSITDLVVTFGDTPTVNETGVCEWAENETPRVIVNQRIWATLADYDKQEVIFHELGHCVLRRVHQSSEIMAYSNTLQIPESVMYPYRINGSVYRDNMTHYHDELFDTGKRNQF